MAIATHLIKIKGYTNMEKWTKEKIKEYIKKKMKNEIESFYHPDLELLNIKDNDIEVWAYISALPSEAKEDVIEKWLNNHIKEDDFIIKDFEVIETGNLVSGNNFFVYLP
jgi:phenylacetate-coenzyme A ligase PaaK-like adenylate-forming protein